MATYAIHAGTLLTGAGLEPLRDGVAVVSDGKIEKITTAGVNFRDTCKTKGIPGIRPLKDP